MSFEDVRASGRLPSPKGVALAVMRLARREDVRIDEVAEVVQADPAISGRLIRIANSALHPGRPVVAVRDAILRLGLRTVRQISLGFSLVDQHREGPCEAFDYRHFWSRSLLLALAARALGARLRTGAVEELFACGLLADIGSLALATVYPAEYNEVLHGAERGDGALLELERAVLHTDHQECTAGLLDEFGIPESFVQAVVDSYQPAEVIPVPGSGGDQLFMALALARRIADVAFAPAALRDERVSALLAEGGTIGLEADALDELTDRVVSEWREWSEWLRVPVPYAQPFARMSPPAASDAGPGGATPGAEPLRVLLIEEDPESRRLLSGIISRLGHAVYPVVSREDALALAVEVVPQVVVADCARLSDADLEFCHSLRDTDWGRSVYLIGLAGAGLQAIPQGESDLHADDYLPTPVSVPLMRLRLRAASRYIQLLREQERDRARLARMSEELAVNRRRLEEAALTDALTRLPNRQAGLESLNLAWSAAGRYQQPLSVMLIDVDGVRDINQRHGHAAGDALVQAVARILRESGRRCDHVSRMGGAEFLVICPNTETDSLRSVACRLGDAVHTLRLREDDQPVPATIGIGMASRESGMSDADALIRAADRALHAAKRSGRGRIGVTVDGRATAVVPGDVDS